MIAEDEQCRATELGEEDGDAYYLFVILDLLQTLQLARDFGARSHSSTESTSDNEWLRLCET